MSVDRGADGAIGTHAGVDAESAAVIAPLGPEVEETKKVNQPSGAGSHKGG